MDDAWWSYREARDKYGSLMESWYGSVSDTQGCVGDAKLTGRQVFLPEINATSVAVPKRARDLDCYARTKFRREYTGVSKEKKKIAVTINGELQRLDPNTSIALRVVRPYSKDFDVTVFLTLQSRRPKMNGNEWHSHRFHGLPTYNDEEEESLLKKLAENFLDHGASRVVAHLYDLIRRPPQMPSKASGAYPGHSENNMRFQLVWPSYVLHLLVHSLVWRDVLLDEKNRKFDLIFKMRADAGWLADAPVAGKDLDMNAVAVKKCLSWDGVNDKLALIPRAYAGSWLSLLEAYYDPSFHGYKNSEQFQLLLAHRHHIPIIEYPVAFPMLDFYWWLPALDSSRGCFPWNYAGVSASLTKCSCLDAQHCRVLQTKLCAGERPLGPGPRTNKKLLLNGGGDVG